jgi:excisionase family DNA binding protein
MTTKEIAAYLRIKERRVYELVRQRAIPCTRVTGKWLFPRTLVDLWLADRVEGERPAKPPPPVVAGSHDPLLEWAVKESGCGLALLPGGSLDGLRRIAGGEALAAGLHLFDAESGTFNLTALGGTFPAPGCVLIAWARRTQGLVLPAGNPRGIRALRNLADKAVPLIRRQPEAGSYLLLAHLLEREGLALDDLATIEETARGETDVGLAILEGRAEAGFAVEAVAHALKLDFLPLMEEAYDLILHRRDYFEKPMQTLLAFARTDAFHDRAQRMGGYDVSDVGSVRFNGP